VRAIEHAGVRPAVARERLGAAWPFKRTKKCRGCPNWTRHQTHLPDTLAPDDCKRWQVFSCRVHKNIITFYACYEMIDASSPGIARWTREL